MRLTNPLVSKEEREFFESVRSGKRPLMEPALQYDGIAIRDVSLPFWRLVWLLVVLMVAQSVAAIPFLIVVAIALSFSG